jgi:hypothetical protein
MRAKRARPSPVPAKYRRYWPADWDNWGQWVTEREAWDADQEPVLLAGCDSYGNAYSYQAGPVGDSTDLMRARREARMSA